MGFNVSGNVCMDGACQTKQVVSIGMAVNSLDSVSILDSCGNPYDNSKLEYSYSVDGINWSCYSSYSDILESTVDLVSDFFIRVKVAGQVSGVNICCEPTTDYSTQIAEGFNFQGCQSSTSMYNPYANMDGAINLQQQLTETISCMLGIPCYYFKVNGVASGADITFKEYALKSVTDVKQVKIIIADGGMPSSKPEFTDFGVDWSSDWEVDISKVMFATAFGDTAQPTEGDLVYIPMMKRMWQVNEAYEEKKDSLMWNATTFKLALTKYQVDSSLSLEDTQSMVDSIVKNKYDDLFGEDENIGSQEEAAMATPPRPDDLYPVYKSDAVRKYLTSERIDWQSTYMYYKGTMLSDNCYRFNNTDAQIIYQQQYCGNEGTMSFIINPLISEVPEYSGTLIEIGHIHLDFSYKADNLKVPLRGGSLTITLNVNKKAKVTLPAGKHYFFYTRWSRKQNNIEMLAAEYKYPENIPLYKVQNHHYYFDVDNPVDKKVTRCSQEMVLSEKKDVIIHGFDGTLTNFKLYDVSNDNVSELMMQYPTGNHLLINDVARPLVGLHGAKPM